MTLSWRLELEFAGISCEFRVSSGLPLHFEQCHIFFIIWTNRIDIFFLTSAVQCSNIWNQGRWSSGRAGGNTIVDPVETYKKQKNNCQLCLFLFSNNLTSTIITEFTQNHCEVSRRAHNFSKSVWIRCWWTIKLPMILLWNGTCAPLLLFRKGRYLGMWFVHFSRGSTVRCIEWEHWSIKWECWR